ncbi:MAG: Ig-like domain-containing protein [Candidatus Zhuqueibacterota bacterium]
MTKKILIILLAFVSVTSAQPDLSGLKFCIDPGHGNYPNDKPFETRINLHVVNYLKAYLEEYGAWVITTRQDSATAISLYDRDQIANNNNVDFFLSVHHNATGTVNNGVNTTLMLYQEMPDGSVRWAGESDVMCQYMADYLQRYLYTTGKSVRGDWSFYGSWTEPFNLGVLKYLLMPGVLSEASFWDYYPEIYRLNALGYLKLEGYALLHSYLEYYTVPRREDSFVEGVLVDTDGAKQNGVTVTLTNGVDTMVYVTDSRNIGVTAQDNAWPGFPYVAPEDIRNGMYFFNSFPPGNAQLIFQRNDLVTDTLDIYVKSATSTRNSPFELVYNIPPVVVSFSPAPGDTNFSVFQDIEINFSRTMSTNSVAAAFQIAPFVAGTLKWENSGRRARFSPGTRYEFDQDYQVEISSAAMDAYGFQLDGDNDGVQGGAFSFSFRTEPMDTSRPMVIDFYPMKNDTGIFVNDILQIGFNKRLDPATISSSKFLLMSDLSRRTSVTVRYDELNGLGLISIIPVVPLDANMGYMLTLVNSLKDYQGNMMDDHFQWAFRAQTQDLTIFPIENFETIADSGLTPLNWRVESNAGMAALQLSSVIRSHGKNAAELSYQFTSAAESLLARVDHASEYVWVKPGSYVSANVLGDASGAQLQFVFEDADGLEASSSCVIDWVGWKNVRIDLASEDFQPWGSSTPGNGALDSSDVYFIGFAVKSNGPCAGQLYLDSIEQLFVPSPMSIPGPGLTDAQPAQFRLYPNYPNPFNPETTIAYDIPSGGSPMVTIQIYDLMGREVRSLVREPHRAGCYRTNWNGRDNGGNSVPSGIYFYRLDADHFSTTKKMLLIR